MLIRELTKQECLDVLARTNLGRLACTQGLQPYVVPFHFAYRDNRLYSFSMPGQKIDWMRANPLVCVEAELAKHEQWTTVVVFGRYEELPDTPEMQGERALAFDLLQQRAAWWEPGSLKISQAGATPALEPVFFSIDLMQITGRCASPDPGTTDTTATAAASAGGSWLHELSRRFQGR
jgi:nitroimidazol reductase NimA-like FMN-containing flavoprotein (pyridoxamine 5'-phosphate oxidase superfamily)